MDAGQLDAAPGDAQLVEQATAADRLELAVITDQCQPPAALVLLKSNSVRCANAIESDRQAIKIRLEFRFMP